MDPILTALAFLLDPTYWVVMLGVVFLAALTSVIPGTNAFLVMALAFPLILFEVDDPAIGLVALATQHIHSERYIPHLQLAGSLEL